jgi:type IV secretory pathway TrbF-like protein
MLKAKDQEPAMAPSRVLITRTQLRMTYLALASLAVTTTLLAGGFWWAASREREVYVLVTDEEGAYVQVALARSKWSPQAAMWRTAAQRWLTNVRARSLDPGEWQRQIRELVATTDRSQWGKVDEWLKGRQPDLMKAVDVEITEATVLNSDGRQANVFLRWRERERQRDGDTGKWVYSAATITLAKGPQQIAGEADLDNPFGLYTYDYEFNPSTQPDGNAS